jgi:hypothetical protein
MMLISGCFYLFLLIAILSSVFLANADANA